MRCCLRNYFETKIHVSLIGISFFLAFAFLMFKTHPNSQYLYWQYDLCVTYYYSIPNYLATALFLYLYTHRTSIENKNLKPIKNGFIVAAIYLLTFSFMPAACVIAANSFWRLFELICKTKDIKQSAKQGWCYIISLVFFCMLIYFEFGRTFGTGYLNSDVSFVNKISVAFLFIIETFGKLHPMVKIFSIIIIVSAVWIAIRKYMRREICELDSKYFRFVWMTGRVIFVLLVYLTLLGSVSMGHLSREIIEIRMDTMYSFYSLLLLLVVVCLMYIIHQNSKAVACIPMILLIMAYPILSHKNYFSSSMYMDSTPAQRYEIMSEIVQEAKRQDRTGEINIIAHIPYGTNPYGMPMLQTLQVHDIVSHGGVIEFVYDPESDFYME